MPEEGPCRGTCNAILVIFAFFIGSSGISRSLIQVLYFQRPSAKELIKHRFIKNARKSPKLLERIRKSRISTIVILSFFPL
jgi:RNA-binding protein YhbY